MAAARVEAVIRRKHRMAEGPVWDERAGELLYVDITAAQVCRWDPRSREVRALGLDAPVGCVGLHGPGSYVVAAGTRLGVLDWGARRVRWAARVDQDKPRNRFNDGKVDPAGRFVAGTMPEETAPGRWAPGQGALYTLGADRSVVRSLRGLGIPNGLDWSLDRRIFYHVDSLARCVRAYDYDVGSGQLAAPRPVFQLPEEQGMPDGLCLDAEGKLWLACIDGGRLLRVDPETGTRLCSVEMPVSRVTSCCFGGPAYSDLYVTSASDGLSPEQWAREPEAGHVFKVTGLGVSGVAPRVYAG